MNYLGPKCDYLGRLALWAIRLHPSVGGKRNNRLPSPVGYRSGAPAEDSAKRSYPARCELISMSLFLLPRHSYAHLTMLSKFLKPSFLLILGATYSSGNAEASFRSSPLTSVFCYSKCL